jgi:hypothetical protein
LGRNRVQQTRRGTGAGSSNQTRIGASAPRHRIWDVVINWGCPVRPAHIPAGANVINPFSRVAIASNKLLTFRELRAAGVYIPECTEDAVEALGWIQGGVTVVARTILNGHGGKGIVLIDHPKDMVAAPLYTRYIPKKSEYRVHVIDGCVVDVTRKVLRDDYPDKNNVNWKIRNHDNGFIFIRENKNFLDRRGNPLREIDCCPGCVRYQAVEAIRALDLDFGAVDVIYNKKSNMAFVLEVNTAPGVADTAAQVYATFLNEMVYGGGHRQAGKDPFEDYDNPQFKQEFFNDDPNL